MRYIICSHKKKQVDPQYEQVDPCLPYVVHELIQNIFLDVNDILVEMLGIKDIRDQDIQGNRIYRASVCGETKEKINKIISNSYAIKK